MYAAGTTWDETGLRQRLQEERNYGFNTIRLIFYAGWWIDDSSTNLDGRATDRPFQYCFINTVRIAQEYGMYIVATMYGPDTSGQPAMPFPSTHIPDQQAFVNFWLDMSAKLRQYPNIIYELYNEPAGSASTWLNAVSAVITAIRNSGDDHIIVVQYGYCGGFVDGGTNWVNDARTQGTNIVYSEHIYKGSGATIPSGTDDYAGIKDYLISHWRYDLVLDPTHSYATKPIWIGEIGAEGTSAYFTNILQLLNDWGMGYAPWCWDQNQGWQLQTFSGNAPYPLNSLGTILVNAIANG
jgi:hypothetical protein